MTNVLVLGAPRSGTTWAGRVLGQADGAVYVHEPDNEDLRPLALRAKRVLGRFPVLGPDDDDETYEALWARAFTGGMPNPPPLRERVATRLFDLGAESRRGNRGPHRNRPAARLAARVAGTGQRSSSPEHVVVKSVHGALAVEWIAQRFRPTVVVVLRHPFAVLASQRRLAMSDMDAGLDSNRRLRERLDTASGVAPPPDDAGLLYRAAWQLGVLTSALCEASERHPDWVVVRHEYLCTDTTSRYAELCDRIGLPWGAGIEAQLGRTNEEGEGYRPFRVATDEVDRWKTSLDEAEQAEARAALQQFPMVAGAFESLS
jgi:hypothetical protein